MTRILFLLALAIGFVSCKAASCANSGLTIRQVCLAHTNRLTVAQLKPISLTFFLLYLQTTFDGTFNQNDIVWLRDPSQSVRFLSS
jgi:hypothetical protein